MFQRRRLLAAVAIVACLIAAAVAAISLASLKAPADAAASGGPGGGTCLPATLNTSAVLPGTTVAVSPLPGAADASARTQISFLGAPAGSLRDIAVRGSRTGSHPGRLRAYSQGDGASFLPYKPFLAGERVTVRGAVESGPGTVPFSYSFTVATEDRLPYVRAHHPARDPQEKQHFRSAPTLEAPIPVITASSPESARGDLFAAVFNGPGPSGPVIFDETGNLVWFDPLPAGTEATNLQVQTLAGRPVLTWWQGYIPPQGFGEGEEVIANSAYHVIDRVQAGNGYKADLHDFHITPQATALVTVFNPIDCNLSSLGGRSDSAVTDTMFQEIDLRTGLVRREWSALDHVALSDSYMTAASADREWPFDFFHLNSVDQTAAGTTLISSRNTSALFELNTISGQVVSQLGGKRSTVKLASGATTAYQHDATVQPNGTITVFDNGSSPKVHPQSRALVLSVNPQTRTESVLSEFTHTRPPLTSESQGSVQVLENGNVFVGWGANPYFTEYSITGALLFDAHLHGSYESYRAYRFPWTGEPATRPAITAGPAGGKGPTVLYVSWNGDTRTSAWRVFAGASPKALAAVTSVPKAGFETAIRLPSRVPYVAVQALDPSGVPLVTSATVRG